jgi:hypothetical protein
MNNETLITILENQLTESTQGTDIYKLRLRRTIDRLKSGAYLNKEDLLITDLESLGFADVGRQVRSGLYT